MQWHKITKPKTDAVAITDITRCTVWGESLVAHFSSSWPDNTDEVLEGTRGVLESSMGEMLLLPLEGVSLQSKVSGGEVIRDLQMAAVFGQV